MGKSKKYGVAIKACPAARKEERPKLYLLEFENGELSIATAQDVKLKSANTCVARVKGGRYAANVLLESDDKSNLIKLKTKKEEKLSGLSCSTALNKTDSNRKNRYETENNCMNFSEYMFSETSTNEDTAIETIECYNTESLNETDNIQVDTTDFSQCIDTDIPNGTDSNISRQGDSYNFSAYIGADSTAISNESISNDNVCKISAVNHKKFLMPTALSQTAGSNNTINETDSTVSKQGDTSNFSEYIPTDLSEDPSIISNNKSIMNDSVNNINEPLNVKQVSVPYSKSNKKHFCIYCKTLQSTISRHLLLKHKQEEEVKKAFYFPKRSKERLEIMNSIRKKGDFEHNTSSKYNSGVLIVSRQQQNKCKNVVDDYVVCKTCMGYFSKRTIRIHKKGCGASKGSRFNQIDSRRLTQYIHQEANYALKTKIFPILRCDEITKTIRYDELVIKFGNYLAEKYLPLHQHDMIRANLRLIGRFIIEIKKIDPAINELKDIYKPSMFDKCINAIRIVAKWNENRMGFETPAVAQNLTTLLKKCGNKQSAEMIKEGRDDIKTEVDKFLQLWNQEIPLVNKKANEDQNNQKRIKKIILPSKEDIKKLHMYLKEKIISTMEKLLKQFCFSSWTNLVQATLIFIQIFNRRRAGEIERLTIENFKNKEIITDNIDKDILKNVSEESIKFAKQFVRISLRGKLGRTVSVLLCPMALKSIEIMLKYRTEAGVDSQNKYIFSKPYTSQLTKQYYRACPLLKMFSKECGARIPESLRGTTLRKHIATYTSLLNIEEASVERLANFMGHHKDVHKSIYRIPIPVAEVTCVSKLLMAAIGDEVEDGAVDGGEDDSEEEENSEVNCLAQINLNSSSSSERKRRSTSPYGKTSRCKWSYAEREAISSIFGDLRSLKNLPSLEECSNAIRESPALKTRTPPQIKSWIHNQRR